MSAQSSVHRFPKWLREETYTIAHDLRTPGRFLVTLFNSTGGRFIGHGHTVVTAAKRAAKNRDFLYYKNCASTPPAFRLTKPSKAISRSAKNRDLQP